MKVDHITNENIISPEEIQKASDTYFQLKRNVGELYAQAFWNKWRESGNVNAALRMAQREYDRLMMKDSEEPKISSDAEVVAEARGMPSKKHVMDMCKDGKTFAEMCKMHPEADKDKLKAMVDKCKEEMKESVSEAMSDAYGIVSAEPEIEGSVEFKQHKNTDKGSVSIEASGETMQDLADVLKLAGLTLPKDMHSDDQESSHDVKPEQEDVLVKPEKDDDSPCGSDDADDNVSYETDKEILVNYIKDQLKKRLS